MQDFISPLHAKRLLFKPAFPQFLDQATCVKAAHTASIRPEILHLFPKTSYTNKWNIVKGAPNNRQGLKVGVLFSGGQAAGGHNVLWGLFDALKGSELLGFLDGLDGFIQNKFIPLDLAAISKVRNLGGFDLIGSGRMKIETKEQFEIAVLNAKKNKLDALVIIGGDDSNTNAAFLAETFLAKGLKTQVIGVPKTIDGDLRAPEIEISFGFDSACKTYSELIGNIARDALSAKKYTHFIKLMGRSASHIALECALQTNPNLALIGEERKTLDQIVQELTDLIVQRSEMGKNYGIILVPEGLVEFIPEIKELIHALNEKKILDGSLKHIFEKIPDKVREQFLLSKDPHGNIQVSQIDTQVLLMTLVEQELQKRNFKGAFHPQEHFFGYEGRSCLPTNFDCNYCYSLGRLVGLGIQEGLTAVIASIQGLKQDSSDWEGCFIPIVSLMDLEERKGKLKPVIQKTLVDLKGKAYLEYQRGKRDLALKDLYRFPGPIQFDGGKEITDLPPLSL